MTTTYKVMTCFRRFDPLFKKASAKADVAVRHTTRYDHRIHHLHRIYHPPTTDESCSSCLLPTKNAGGGSNGRSSEMCSSAVPPSTTTSATPSTPPVLVDVTKYPLDRTPGTAIPAGERETIQDGSDDQNNGSSNSPSKSSSAPALASSRPSRSPGASSPAGPSSKTEEIRAGCRSIHRWEVWIMSGFTVLGVVQ